MDIAIEMARLVLEMRDGTVVLVPSSSAFAASGKIAATRKTEVRFQQDRSEVA
jgi:hypothetical protein